MPDIVTVTDLRKTFDGGFEALKGVTLNIREGEVLALLGPNGAGKTTLISAVCGLTSITSGTITVGGHDVVRDFRESRRLIGLVPQEITLEPFEKVLNAVRFSRGLFGRPANDAYLEKLLKQLSLWDKKDGPTKELSGGMKRRVLIAKALAHEPRVLFLDEPTAGVDVELRKEMWDVVRELKEDGVTIILTTHYIEEAEEIADRVAIINGGKIIVVDEKTELMRKLGKKQLVLELPKPLKTIPGALECYDLDLAENGMQLVYTYDVHAESKGITALMADLVEAGIRYRDMETKQSSLEDIFVDLVRSTP